MTIPLGLDSPGRLARTLPGPQNPENFIDIDWYHRSCCRAPGWGTVGRFAASAFEFQKNNHSSCTGVWGAHLTTRSVGASGHQPNALAAGCWHTGVREPDPPRTSKSGSLEWFCPVRPSSTDWFQGRLLRHESHANLAGVDHARKHDPLFVSFALSEAAAIATIQRWPYHPIDQVVHTQMSARLITEDRAFVRVS